MGKKVKTGKARKDKFYKLAKETETKWKIRPVGDTDGQLLFKGYRSRAAFKLIQLNRKYSFLQNSRVVLDLCAAPGGWLQVAAQNTPLSSIIVGVDLVPIPAIRRVTTLTEDITTDKCTKELKKVFKKWQVDCVLHDGAPNVGQSWTHDAYQQATLTLAAVKLATIFLKKGGWFITKMFRSKDYNSLQWVFQQLFKHVHTTKPQASRTESSEVYIICQGYLAPDKIDPKFLDLKHVFKDVDQDRTLLPQLDLKKPSVVIKQTQGYPEGETLLYHTMTASEFMTSANHLERLADVTQIVFEGDEIANNPLTTLEIKALCEDIKVINKRDINRLLKWRKAYLKTEKDANKTETDDKPKEATPEEDDSEAEEAALEQKIDDITPKEAAPEEDDSEAEEAALEQKIDDIRQREATEEKKKLRKIKEEKIKLKTKLAKARASVGEDGGGIVEDTELFSLKNIKNKEQLKKVSEGDLTILDADYDDAEEKPSIRCRPPDVLIDKETKEYMDDTDDDISTDEDEDYMRREEEAVVKRTVHETKNPLMLHLEDKKTRAARITSEWFSKDSFAGIEDERDEDVEMDKMVEDFKRKGGKLIDTAAKKPRLTEPTDDEPESDNEEEIPEATPVDEPSDTEPMDQSDEDDSESDEEQINEDIDKNSAALASRLVAEANVASTPDVAPSSKTNDKISGKKKGGKEKNIPAGGFEIVPAEQKPLPTSLDEVGLALGAAIASSRKRRREIIEDGFNRHYSGRL